MNPIVRLLFCSFAICILGLLSWQDANQISELSRHGKTVRGTVLQYERQVVRGRRNRERELLVHTILYDGHVKKFELKEHIRIGSHPLVLYSVQHPEVAMITRSKLTSLWSISLEKITGFGFLFLLVAFPLLFWLMYRDIRHLLGFDATPGAEDSR